MVEASPGKPAEPHLRPTSGLRLDRFKDVITDPVAHFTGVFQWGTNAFDPEELFRTAADFLPDDGAMAELGRVGPDAFLETGPLRWSRDSSVGPAGA